MLGIFERLLADLADLVLTNFQSLSNVSLRRGLDPQIGRSSYFPSTQYPVGKVKGIHSRVSELALLLHSHLFKISAGL